MKAENNQLRYLSGDQAYEIYLKQFYYDKPKISSIKAVDLNLEIIVDYDDTLLAYRYDPPDEMLGMSDDKGLWKIFQEDFMDLDTLASVKEYISKIRLGNHLDFMAYFLLYFLFTKFGTLIVFHNGGFTDQIIICKIRSHPRLHHHRGR